MLDRVWSSPLLILWTALPLAVNCGLVQRGESKPHPSYFFYTGIPPVPPVSTKIGFKTFFLRTIEGGPPSHFCGVRPTTFKIPGSGDPPTVDISRAWGIDVALFRSSLRNREPLLLLLTSMRGGSALHTSLLFCLDILGSGRDSAPDLGNTFSSKDGTTPSHSRFFQYRCVRTSAQLLLLTISGERICHDRRRVCLREQRLQMLVVARKELSVSFISRFGSCATGGMEAEIARCRSVNPPSHGLATAHLLLLHQRSVWGVSGTLLVFLKVIRSPTSNYLRASLLLALCAERTSFLVCAERTAIVPAFKT
ncbi:hypothetical protein B0H19DRAFT_1062463 [Mycena capillaripes]|nr:hypothetical protein B0H19DRAFT_1062463 [Mycena capillaripes]